MQLLLYSSVGFILKLRGPDGFGGCLGTNIPTHSGSRDPHPQAWSSLLPAPVRLQAGAMVSKVLLMNWRHVSFLRRFGPLTVLKPTSPDLSSGFSRGRQLLMKCLTGDTVTKCCGHAPIPKIFWGSGALWVFPSGSVLKNLPASAGDARDVGSIPGSGRSSRGWYGNPLQDSCLENPMDRGAGWATVHGLTKSQTQLK